MKLIVDMNLSPRWADFLQRAGLDAVHWSHVGAADAPDVEIMAYAKALRQNGDRVDRGRFAHHRSQADTDEIAATAVQ